MPLVSYSIDLDALGGPHRLDALAEAYKPMWGDTVPKAASPGMTPVHRLCSKRLGPVRFTTGAYRGIELRLRAERNLDAVEQLYCLGFPRAGAARIMASEGPRLLQPGEFFLSHNWRNAGISIGEGFENFHVLVPRRLVEERVRGGVPPMQLRLADSTRAAMLASYLGALHQRLDAIADAEMDFYARQVVDLVGFVLSGRDAFASGDSSVVAAHRQRVLQYISRHCLEPDLDATRIAVACGVSIRYLHRIFSGSEHSVMERVWNARLDHAHRLLLDGFSHRRSVAEVAYASGFTSAAAFSRAYKRRYGLAPRDAR